MAVYIDQEGNKTEFDPGENWRRLKELVRPYTKLFINVALGMVLLAIVRLAMPWPIKFLLDEVFPLGTNAVASLGLVVGGILLLHGLMATLQYVNGFVLSFIGNRLGFDLRRKLFAHLHRLSMSFHDAQKRGSLMSRFTEDVNSIRGLVVGQSMQMITSVLVFFIALGIIFFISPLLGLLSLAVLPLHVLALLFFRKRVKDAAHKTRRNFAQLCGSINETLAGAKVVKSFTSEGRETKSFVKGARKHVLLSLDQANWRLWWSVVANLLHGLGKGVVFAAGGMMVLRGTMNPGTFVVIASYTQMLHQPLIQFVNMLNQVLPAMVGVERVFEILSTVPEVEDAEDAVHAPPLKGDVEFKNVSFSYDNGLPVLKDISFNVKPGEVVAFVGPSGSGKSTIANLVMRFYDVSEGQVLVDGEDVRRFKQRSYRNQIGLVMQDSFLFSGTLEENIRYGRPDATMAEVHEAARQANAYDFIMETENGFQTEVGENGTMLSGGQKQRIAIARAILRDPKLLVLDEATSALDTKSETIIQAAMDRLMEGRTCFVIAHRLSTIRNADKIVVLKDGEVVEIGTHEELLARKGMYYGLYNPQFEEETDRAPYELMEVA